MKKPGYSLLLAATLGGAVLIARGQDTPAAPAAPADKPAAAEDAAATPVVPRDTSPPAPAEKKPASAAKPAKSADNPLDFLTGKKKTSKSTGSSPASSASFPDAAGVDAVLFTILVNGDKERFVIKLRPDLAPKTVANFKKNVENGFYNGLAFHRVIRNYLVQTGDPLSKDDAQKEQWGTTNVGQNIPGEFAGKHIRYAVAMAHKAGESTSSGSQFYIMLRPASNLDGSYAVFGEVTGGTDVLSRLSGVIVNTNDAPLKRLEVVNARVISSTAQLALDDGVAGRRKTKPDSQKGPVEKFIERVW